MRRILEVFDILTLVFSGIILYVLFGLIAASPLLLGIYLLMMAVR